MTLEKLRETFGNISKSSNSFKVVNFFSNDSISKNAVIILLTLGMAAAAGFIFTIIAAKMYTIESLGVATVLFSYANILVLITRFGTEQSMIRYYNSREKSAIFCSSIFITTVAAILLSLLLISISYLGIFDLDYLLTYSVVFIIGVAILSVSQVCGAFFLACGNAIMYFYQNIITSSRFLLLFIFISFGVLGIFSSLVIASGLSAIFALLILFDFGVRFQLPEKKFLIDSFHFSFSNYISDCLLTAPVFLIPILVYFISGKSAIAIYSVSYAFASIAFIIPVSVGYGIFISGCQKQTTRLSMRAVIGISLAVLIGLILTFMFLGQEIILILGPDYAGTAELIVIIMSSSVFALFFQVYSADFKLCHQMKELVVLNGVFFISLMSLSYFLIRNLGLIGVGYAWIAAYAICVLPLFFHSLIKKNQARPKNCIS